jgi:2-amino-4-hydroxy-6-hydroxymethyldihydropteridine diphosphokinase
VAKHVQAFVGLGSNLGDREASLRFAVRSMAELSDVSVASISRVYETDAIGPGVQGPYLNAVVKLSCESSPKVLLEGLLAIEVKGGRDRKGDAERWSARTLDLDLLFFGDACTDEPGLSLPHPRLHRRVFVLEPLCDLAPNYVHPRLGVTIAELAQNMREGSKVRVWPGSLHFPS